MPDKNPKYNSTITGKGTLLSETKIVMAEIAAGKDLDLIRGDVIQQDLLDRMTSHTREKVWKEIYRRYISNRDADHILGLAKFVTNCKNPTAVDLILFYENCLVDPLLYDLTAECTYSLYQSARSTIDAIDINEWLSAKERQHPEISTWSAKTRSRLITSYLATIRDFGLVTGIKQKYFHKVYVPREAFVYALYFQRDKGIQGKALIQCMDWRLFLLSENEVVYMFQDAAIGGFLNFRYAGDIYEIRFTYNSLKEVIDAIIVR